MRERWRRVYGPEVSASILEANLRPPPTYLRLNARYPLEELSLDSPTKGSKPKPRSCAGAESSDKAGHKPASATGKGEFESRTSAPKP